MQNLIPGFPATTNMAGTTGSFNVNQTPGNLFGIGAVKVWNNAPLTMSYFQTFYPDLMYDPRLVREDVDISELMGSREKQLIMSINKAIRPYPGDLVWQTSTFYTRGTGYKYDGYTQLQLNTLLEVEWRTLQKLIEARFINTIEANRELQTFMRNSRATFEEMKYVRDFSVRVSNKVGEMKRDDEKRELNKIFAGKRSLQSTYDTFLHNNLVVGCMDIDTVMNRFNYIGVCFTCVEGPDDLRNKHAWKLSVVFKEQIEAYLNNRKARNGMRFSEYWYQYETEDVVSPVQLYISETQRSVKNVESEIENVLRDRKGRNIKVVVKRGRILGICKKNLSHYAPDATYDRMQRFPFDEDNKDTLSKTHDLIHQNSSHRRQRCIINVN